MKYAVPALLALVLDGCAPSTLTTRVEVYDAKARVAELKLEARSDSRSQAVEKLLKDRIAAEQVTVRQIDALLRRVGALRSLPASAWDAYEKQEAVKGNEVFRKAVRGARTAHIERADSIISKASNELAQLRSNRLDGLTFASWAYSEMGRIVEELRVSLETALSPASVVAKGDPTGALPPVLESALDAAVIRLGPELAAAWGEVTLRASDLPVFTAGFFRLPRDLAGIERRNTFEETVTDPLLTFALNDPDGWKAVPMSVRASTEGKSEVALVRETPDSFSVFALTNDPSGLFRQRLRIASSTVNLLAKLASSYFGLPATAIGQKPQKKDSAGEPVSAEPAAVPAAARIRIAERRLVELEDLLRQTPTTPAEVRHWVTRANALLESEWR